ncbi:cysteine dioxygenase family protein [Ottowia thiooxydans]|uniref:cysteine dioxygenase family protein n=1 Tax=Ottowia thiooxydans TaxID=219182 RepID=UPI0004133A25|nr:cysteine dioxygenase family protein [Ottowia thiooxydans]
MSIDPSRRLIEARVALVDDTMARIRSLAASAPLSRELLTEIAALLQPLADQQDYFTAEDFPVAEPGGMGIARYLLASQPDDSFALYLNSINPGMNSPPHDHTTWAVIVALEGQELNRLYERVDDGSSPDQAELAKRSEFMVERGRSIQFLPDDIHSIHIQGDQPTRHFHLYGRALETLDERVGYNLETGAVVKFNRNFLDKPRLMPR